MSAEGHSDDRRYHDDDRADQKSIDTDIDAIGEILEPLAHGEIRQGPGDQIGYQYISATNRDIHKAVADGIFRQDLLYRINTVELHLPPLRERGDDIQKLAEFFLARFRLKYDKTLAGIAPAAINLLQRYHWPGNVRELQHVVERAVIMTSSRILQPADFVLSSAKERGKEDLSLRDFNLEQVEKAVIVKALGKHQGNITQAARELGLTRTSLYRRMEKHGL